MLTSQTQPQVMERFREIGRQIRSGQLDLGRHHYALCVAHAAMQAIHCGYDRISVVELGVAHGNGLLDLCRSAEFFKNECGLDIEVVGFDNASGLPPSSDYRDHPEIWHSGQFAMGDPALLRARLPSFARLEIGDVGETIAGFSPDHIGFVAIDLDYYSSTKAALPLFEMPPDRYLPAMPLYVDDVEVVISYNEWAGEALAIKEFNASHEFRKIDRKPQFNIHNFHVLHVLDHPMRNGVRPRLPFEIWPI